MKLQLKTFSIPACGSEMMEEYINKFLRSKRIINIEKHFSPDSGGYWTFCVEYMEQDSASEKEQNDPLDGLTEIQKERYEHYREIRNEVAVKNNIKHYLIFNNNELAAMSKLDRIGPDVTHIAGVSPQRLKDYLSYFYTTDISPKDSSKNATATEQPNGADKPF